MTSRSSPHQLWGQVAKFEDVAVGDATDAHREFAVNAAADAQAFDVLTNQRQTGIGGKVVGQFFDNKVGHAKLTFRIASTWGLSA